jgi:toxin-antitoxin system PIN domain toxin
MTVYLLDVNLLIALCDPMHLHHQAAHDWFAAVGRAAWATCPMTENGFVRIASHPGYPNRPGDAPAVLEILRRFCAAAGHHFWTDSISLRDALLPGASFVHAQLTDLYLLALAANQAGKLATFDRRIPTGAVRGGAEALAPIG